MNETINEKDLADLLIYNLRGQSVLLDRDLAILYGVETRRINEQVRRNKARFPEDFMFQLSFRDTVVIREQICQKRMQLFENKNDTNLKSQIAISSLQSIENEKIMDIQVLSTKEWGGDRHYPYAFTENGVAMLSSVLKSQRAIDINIMIMRTFVAMRRFLSSNAQMFQRVETLEHRQLSLEERVGSHSNQIEEVFRRLDEKQATPQQGVFFNGEIFGAYRFVCDRVREARKSIVLIDNYIDDTVLELLDKRSDGVSATIYTEKISDRLQQDIVKHNAQYPPIPVLIVKTFHDRFLMIDEAVYHLGASVKDLGKKVFAFSLLQGFSASTFLRLMFQSQKF